MAYLSGFNAYWKMQLDDGDMVKLGGQTSHSQTTSNQLIELNKKENNEFRTLLPNKGTRNSDVSIELVVTDSASLAEIKQAADDRLERNFYVVRIMDGVTKTSEFKMMVASYTENGEDGDASRVTINLQSTNAYDVGVILVQFLTSDGEVFLDSFGDRFLVREA